MIELREFAEGRAREFIESVSGFEAVHGVVIDIDPRWYAGWVASQQMLAEDVRTRAERPGDH